MKSKNLSSSNLSIVLLNYLIAVSLLFSVISGCTKKEAKIESQPGEITRAAGLVTSGQYRSIAIEDMDDDGNKDVVSALNHFSAIDGNYSTQFVVINRLNSVVDEDFESYDINSGINGLGSWRSNDNGGSYSIVSRLV